jgi:hypothetical protein
MQYNALMYSTAVIITSIGSRIIYVSYIVVNSKKIPLSSLTHFDKIIYEIEYLGVSPSSEKIPALWPWKLFRCLWM